MEYSFKDEQGIARTMSLSNEDSIRAAKNEFEELERKYNPDVVKLNRVRTQAGEVLRLEVTVVAPSHYLTDYADEEPKPCGSMTATIVVKMGYPIVGIEASYDPKHYLASPNVFTSGKACIDGWVPFKSSLISVVDKLVRDMIHDPEVTKYNSMANYSMEVWHKKGVREGRFPTIDPVRLYMKEKVGLPPRVSGVSAVYSSVRVASLPPRS